MATARTTRADLDLAIERRCWEGGLRWVAGIDEVGRGALAGPLVAAAVVLPPELEPSVLAGLTDSKVLSPERREEWVIAIQACAVAIGVGWVEADELDAIGIGPANRAAMERAVFALPIEPDLLLLDATTIDLEIPQVGFIDGDALCLSIAAASVVAKVTRDRRMRELDRIDDRYAFAEHKGYGTASHLKALSLHGPCASHRRCFAPVSACLAS